MGLEGLGFRVLGFRVYGFRGLGLTSTPKVEEWPFGLCLGVLG